MAMIRRLRDRPGVQMFLVVLDGMRTTPCQLRPLKDANPKEQANAGKGEPPDT